MEEELKKKLEKQTKEKIEQVLEQGISSNNIDILDKLVDIYKDTKEVENMYGNYGNYGNYGRENYGNYGNYGEGSYGRNSYGRRGYDTKYRGQDSLDRMYGEYERYQESKSRYGHNEDTDKSFEYMVKSLEDFIKYLHEEAETPQQHQMLNETLQRSMR